MLTLKKKSRKAIAIRNKIHAIKKHLIVLKETKSPKPKIIEGLIEYWNNKMAELKYELNHNC